MNKIKQCVLLQRIRGQSQAHNQILAHAWAYRLYQEGGQVGIR